MLTQKRKGYLDKNSIFFEILKIYIRVVLGL
jgi:hypothetical protein